MRENVDNDVFISHYTASCHSIKCDKINGRIHYSSCTIILCRTIILTFYGTCYTFRPAQSSQYYVALSIWRMAPRDDSGPASQKKRDKYYFTNTVVNLKLGTVSLTMLYYLKLWTLSLKSQLDKVWQHQDMIYDFQAELHGTGSLHSS